MFQELPKIVLDSCLGPLSWFQRPLLFVMLRTLEPRSPIFEPDEKFFLCISAGDVRSMSTDGAVGHGALGFGKPVV